MNKKFILTLLFVFVVLLAGFLYFSLILNPQFSILNSGQAAAANYDLSGWLWSSNIGWVKLNNVAVSSSTGALSGYAWSSNIGWIDFGPTSGFPASPSYSAKINLLTGEATGWMKAVQADKTNGGWDGWIKITNANATYGGSGDGTLSGWAWGDLVIGWLNFYNVTAPPLINCDFSANPASVKLSESSVLSWSCTPAATSCSINYSNVGGSGSVVSPTALPSGNFTVRQPYTTDYVLVCQGLGGPRTFTTAVTVIGSGPTSTSTIQFQYKEVIPR